MSDVDHPSILPGSWDEGEQENSPYPVPEEREVGRVAQQPTAEEIAERVYRLLMRDLRIERERRGGRDEPSA